MREGCDCDRTSMDGETFISCKGEIARRHRKAMQMLSLRRLSTMQPREVRFVHPQSSYDLLTPFPVELSCGNCLDPVANL